MPDELRGNIIKAYCILRQGYYGSDKLAEELRAYVGRVMGPIAKPATVEFVDGLPKTRSGKIMHRVLEAQALGQELGPSTSVRGRPPHSWGWAAFYQNLAHLA